MLVLSRKQDEEIVIDGCIRVKVIRLSGNRVQLGITAPDAVRIERPELAFKVDHTEFDFRNERELVAV